MQNASQFANKPRMSLQKILHFRDHEVLKACPISRDVTAVIVCVGKVCSLMFKPVLEAYFKISFIKTKYNTIVFFICFYWHYKL